MASTPWLAPTKSPGLLVVRTARTSVEEGEATHTIGDLKIEVSAGQIVVAPAGVLHKFVNSGSGPLRQVDIHPSERIRQLDIPQDV